MRGSIQRRGEVWRLVVDGGADPITGRRRQLSRTVRGTKRDAESALARFVAEASGGQLRGHDASLGDVVHAWLAHVLPELSPTTARDYAGAVAKHIDPAAIAAVPAFKVTAADLDRWYRTLSAGGLGPARVHRLHGLLRRSLGQAVRWGWVPRNAALDATPPSLERSRVRPPSLDELRALVGAAEGDMAVWLRLDASLGARRGEVCALRWSDVDFEAATVTIRRALVDAGNGVIVTKSTKTGRDRTVALDAATVRLLREHRRAGIERALALGVHLVDDAWIFATDVEGSRPWRPDYVTGAFGRLRARCGIEGVRLHDVRHFVATQLLSAGVDVRTVAGRLGHARPSTTLDIYAAFVPARDRDAADILGAMMA